MPIRAVGPTVHYMVRRTDGGRRLSWPRGCGVALEPVGGNRFAASLGSMTFARGPGGTATVLAISNRRLRRFVAMLAIEK